LVESNKELFQDLWAFFGDEVVGCFDFLLPLICREYSVNGKLVNVHLHEEWEQKEIKECEENEKAV
jgi:hypothetical protein